MPLGFSFIGGGYVTLPSSEKLQKFRQYFTCNFWTRVYNSTFLRLATVYLFLILIISSSYKKMSQLRLLSLQSRECWRLLSLQQKGNTVSLPAACVQQHNTEPASCSSPAQSAVLWSFPATGQGLASQSTAVPEGSGSWGDDKCYNVTSSLWPRCLARLTILWG